MTALWQMSIIDRIAYDSYRINITSIDTEHDISMRGDMAWTKHYASKLA